MIVDKLFVCQEMFRRACTFCECADMAKSKRQHDTADLGFYTAPTVVNSGFACEVFMKAILLHMDTDTPRTHNLRELYEILPNELKDWIKSVASRGEQRGWTNTWGYDYLDEVADVLVKWRYSYENDWSKSGVMRISIGFLNDFRDALREACCQLFFNMTWEEYGGKTK